MLKCLNCGNKMVESNQEIKLEEGYRTFYQEYFCFHCYELYICSSQSGDMVPEYLELCGVIEFV